MTFNQIAKKLNNEGYVSARGKLFTRNHVHSIVSFVRCSGELFPADCFFHFTISQRTPLLQQSIYSDYQYFLYETISELRDKNLTFDQIANELNRKGYLSVRGKVFKGNHVHSIVKKKRLKDESHRMISLGGTLQISKYT